MESKYPCLERTLNWTLGQEKINLVNKNKTQALSSKSKHKGPFHRKIITRNGNVALLEKSGYQIIMRLIKNGFGMSSYTTLSLQS